MKNYLFIFILITFSYFNIIYSMTQESTSLAMQKAAILSILTDPNQTITEEVFDQVKNIYHQLDSNNSYKLLIELYDLLFGYNPITIDRYESPNLTTEMEEWILDRFKKRRKIPSVALPK